MSTLSSASTIAEIEAAFMDNASFEEDASLAKAKALITAGTLWLFKRPVSSGADGNSVTLNVQFVQGLIDQARAYVNFASRPSGGIKFLAVDEGFR